MLILSGVKLMKKFIFLFLALLSLNTFGMEVGEEELVQDVCFIESIPDEILVMIFEHGARDCFFSGNGVSCNFKLNNLGKSCNQFLDFFGTIELICKRFNKCSNLIIGSWSLMNLDDELKNMGESRSGLTGEFLSQLKFLSPTVKIRALNFMIKDYTSYIFYNRFFAGLKQTYFWFWVYGTESKNKLTSFFESHKDIDIASFSSEQLEQHCNEIIGLLISGINPNELVRYKYRDRVEKASLLSMAIRVKECRDLVRFLLFRRFYSFQEINLDVPNSNGETPLLMSLSENNYNLANTLLAKGADPKICNRDGMTPLMYAIRYCKDFKQLLRSNLLNILLDLGVDINDQDDFGRSALFIAIKLGNEKEVSWLIDHGVRLNDLLSENGNEKSALYWAISLPKSKEEIVQLLLDNGADINRKDNSDESVIQYAKRSYLVTDSILKMLEAKEKENLELGGAHFCTLF